MRGEPSVVDRGDRLPTTARGRSRRARSGRRTSVAARFAANAEPTPPVPMTRILTRRVLPERGALAARCASVASGFRAAEEAMSVAVSQQKMFVDGEFVDALSGETMEVLNPATGEVIAEVPKAGQGGRRPRGRGRREGLGDVARQDAEGPHGAAPEARRRDRRERGGARAARVAQRRQAVVGRRRRAGCDVRQPPLLRGRGAEPRGEGGDGVRRGLHLDDPPRAARHRRRDRAVELPALHGDLEDGAGARRRERPDHQARRADAADRRCGSSSSHRRSSRRGSCRSSRAKACPPATGSCGIPRSGSCR